MKQAISGTFFWGEPSASVFFCEDKYVVVPWIAEFYNTISCLSFILAGLPFIRTNVKDVAWMSILVGLGSMVLHTTLQQYGQCMDEISMILLIFFAAKHYNKNLQTVFLVPIIAIYYKNCEYFISFFVIFTAMLYNLWSEIKARKHRMQKRYFYAFPVLFILGFTCWLADMFLCDYVQPYQLHAWWHINIGLLIYRTFY